MTRFLITGTLLLTISVLLFVTGCDKEKIVTSTEIVREVEYVELPPDTVFQTDSVFVNDSITVYQTDTLYLNDTIIQIEYIHDTITINNTITITDTVTLSQCDPNEIFALSALQHYSNPLVIDLVTQEFGITNGWIFYLSALQSDFTKQATDTYDIYGYIDFNTTDWSGAYLIEYLWRMKYTGGDPADPANWQMTDPPLVSNNFKPGLTISPDRSGLQSDR